MILSRPTMQGILINNHIWEVPNEPGWEEVIKDVESVQNLLRMCTSVAECRQLVNELRAVFYRHKVSRLYLESSANDNNDIMASIFKWG